MKSRIHNWHGGSALGEERAGRSECVLQKTVVDRRRRRDIVQFRTQADEPTLDDLRRLGHEQQLRDLVRHTQPLFRFVIADVSTLAIRQIADESSVVD